MYLQCKMLIITEMKYEILGEIHTSDKLITSSLSNELIISSHSKEPPVQNNLIPKSVEFYGNFELVANNWPLPIFYRAKSH